MLPALEVSPFQTAAIVLPPLVLPIFLDLVQRKACLVLRWQHVNQVALDLPPPVDTLLPPATSTRILLVPIQVHKSPKNPFPRDNANPLPTAMENFNRSMETLVPSASIPIHRVPPEDNVSLVKMENAFPST